MTNDIKDNIEILLKVPLFRAIEKTELEYILMCLGPIIKKYDKGEFITIEGDPFEGLGIVIDGKVNVTKSNEAGEQIIMAQMKKTGVFGEMVAFSSHKVWPATVIAVTNCEIMTVRPEVIITNCQKMCIGHKQLMINMLEIVSDKALGLNRKVNYLSIKSMRGKIAKYLMEEYKKTEKIMFEIGYNRNELAEFLHVSRPSMSRELSRMKEEGIIDYHQSTFKVIDVQALSDFASHLN